MKGLVWNEPPELRSVLCLRLMVGGSSLAGGGRPEKDSLISLMSISLPNTAMW